MNIVGLNAYHGDASACLLINGKLIAAAEEERFKRIKHWAGFPSSAISYCLAESSLTLSDIDVIAINSDPRANIWKKIAYTLKQRPDTSALLERVKNAKKRHSIAEELLRYFPEQGFTGKIVNVEHHLAHLASSYYVSPFDEAVTVSVDGFGDFSSAAWGVGCLNNIDVQQYIHFPHSLGLFYQALTQFLGFPNYGDEYKVMGLAPYGNPAYLEKMREIVLLKDNGSFQLNLDYFIHHKESINYQWLDGTPTVGNLFNANLETLLGPSRKSTEELNQTHYDIAHSIQAMYEEAFFHFINAAQKNTGISQITIAGGCGMNSVANGKIYRFTNYKKSYIQSAAGDAGGAIGAAFVANQENSNCKERFFMDHAYWGPGYDNSQIHSIIQKYESNLEAANCHWDHIDDFDRLCALTVDAITDAGVIGWFQGRMEWGPRALGNRSILCDPRRADAKDILNRKIKRRESFRPFAPSILRDEVVNWFEEEDDVPFMMKVFQIRAEKRKFIPAVTHVDGSGRLQTVFENTNPHYYQLIRTFYESTGVPILLNTSFNENEPVVCRPEEALDCFLRTKMDVLVLGNYFIKRKNS